jgi:chemotaxis protein methyltransferase CheR
MGMAAPPPVRQIANQSIFNTNKDVLSRAQYEKLCRLIYDISGIALGESKEELLRSRMIKLLRASRTSTVDEYITRMQADESGELLVAFLDAVTTNKTNFFREKIHFDFLADTILPNLSEIVPKGENLRIWCAASSTGEEPYTIAMVLLENKARWSPYGVTVLASDLSAKVLNQASQGIYATNKLEGIPQELLPRYFLKGVKHRQGFVRVKDELRRLIKFSRINLMEPFSFSKPFQVIFCRNVMIYFDRPTQEKLVAKFDNIMSPGGYLLVGHSESLSGIAHNFKFMCPSTYRKAL